MAISGPTTNHHEIRFWAEKHQAVPTEILPQIIDTVPTELRFMFLERAMRTADIRVLPWEEFFAKFDELGLTFVYEGDSSGWNELLQREEASPYRNPAYGVPKTSN